MKTLLIFLLLSNIVFSQIDTTIQSSFYARVMPVSIYAGAGNLKDKISQNIEAGISYGVMDMGLAIGSFTQRRDTTTFVELKMTMDASQYGIFSNEFSVGFGHVFKSNTPIMLDASYTIMAQVHKMWGIGITTGYYDFAGNTVDLPKNYYGIFIRYGALRNMNGGLNRTRNHHHK